MIYIIDIVISDVSDTAYGTYTCTVENKKHKYSETKKGIIKNEKKVEKARGEPYEIS